MKLKKRTLIIFVIIMASILSSVQNIAYATSGTLGLKLSYKRYTSSEGWGYALNNGTAHPIYQILKVNGSNITGTNYFCLDPKTSYSWNYHTETDSNGHAYHVAGNISNTTNYTDYYDMEKANLSDLDKFSSKSAVVKNYKQIMWILDNMYVASIDSNTLNTATGNLKAVEEIMSKAGIVYGNTGATRAGQPIYSYYGDEDNNTYYSRYKTNTLYANRDANGGYFYRNASEEQVNVLLSKEQVEAIEQAALWYFTNYYKVNNDNTNGDTQYNMYTQVKGPNTNGDNPTNNFGDAGWLKYTSGTDTNSYNWPLLNSITTNNENEGKMLQEQATILYNYLIDAANDYAATNESYVANSNPITLVATKVASKTVGTNKVLGKFVINKDTTNATPYTLDNEIQILDVNENPITGAEIVDSNGTKINKTAGQMIGQEFYVSVLSSSNINKVVVKVTGNYDTTKKLLWLSSENTEQPIVEIRRTPEPIALTASIEEDKIFDLALRKAIISVNGSDQNVKNENGHSAIRNLTYDESTLSTGTTATYKHRKDPVMVEEGNTVTYSLTVFNEGSRKGYAAEIIDKLPDGLVPKAYADNGTTTGTLEGFTSNPRKNYNGGTVVSSHSYEYNPQTNTIKITNESKGILNDYGREDADGISSERITIECVVTKKASSSNYTYLTNIAYISKAYDSEVENSDGTTGKEITTNVVGDDRDSAPGAYPTATLVTTSATKGGYAGFKGSTNNSVYSGTNNNIYFAGQQDDDDFEIVVLEPKKFDLSLRKQITKIEHIEGNSTVEYNEGATNSRFAVLDNSINNTIYSYYDVDNNIPVVTANDIVTYSIRVYNEGDIAGTATWVTDILPTGLEYIVDNQINQNNGWKAYKEVTSTETGAIKIGEKYYKEVGYDSNEITLYATQKLSSETINAYSGNGNADYKEIYMVARVKAKSELASGITYSLRNFAEIGEDTDDDIDSTPGNDEDRARRDEDDLDIEDLKLPEGNYELDIVKTDKKGQTITDLVSGFTINNGSEQRTTNGVLKLANKQIEETATKDTYEIIETTAPDSYSKFDGKIKIEVAKRFKDDKYEVDLDNTTITVYDSQGNVLANGQTESKEIGITLTQTTTKVQVNVENERLDLSLRKFISATGTDLYELLNKPHRNDGESSNTLNVDNSQIAGGSREPKVDTSKLKAGTATTAIYNHPKDAVEVKREDYVLYTIRVYNEGEADMYASEITDYLPEYLEYVPCHFNEINGWSLDTNDTANKTVRTSYLSSGKEYETILKAFDSKNDDGKGSGLSYRDVQILTKVKKEAKINQNITNIAEVSEYKNKYTEVIAKDRDSSSNNIGTKTDLSQNVRPNYDGGTEGRTTKYIPGQEDDDDFERVIVKRFDLALRKQIVKIEHKEENKTVEYKENTDNSRFATLDNSINNTIYSYYDVEHNIPIVTANDIVTYTIRVYNEGEVDGTATWVTDRLPSGLEYLVDNEINQNNGWKAYKEVASTEEGAIKIGEKYYKEVEYTSNNITLYASQHLKDETIKAYTGTGEASYKEVQMVTRVKAKSELENGVEYKLRNTAEIGDDNGDDEDSTPGNDEEIKKEDDLDIEDLKLPEGEYELDIVKTDKKGNTITDLVSGFSVNGGSEKQTTNGVLKLGTKKIEETGTKDKYEIVETTAPDTYSRFNGKIIIEVAKQFKDDKYQVDTNKTTITVYDEQGKILADGQTASKEIGITLTATTTKVQVNVENERLDLALRKFISAVSMDMTFEDGEYLSTDKTSKSEYTRAPKLDTTKLKDGTATTAIYEHPKEAVQVALNSYVLYTIRVYNEGEADTYASVITDHLPTYLNYIDCKFNQDFGWQVAKDGKTVTTNYLSKEKETATNKTILKAFDSKNDNGKGSGVSFRDVQILARVNDKAESNKNITNIAEISEYEGEDGTKLKEDRDSKPDNLGEDLLKQEVRPDYEGGKDDDKTDGYVPGQEDDDDFERVVVKRFDLSLRKQIVNIQNAYTKQDEKHDRFAKLDTEKKEKNTIYTYFDVESNIPQVVANDVVTYSIRVYNEGEVDGTASWVTDRMPSGLEYLVDNDTNKKYGWKAYKEVQETEEGAIKIGEKYYKEVEYTSKEITLYATEYLKDATIKAYTGEGEADYKEVYMVARVKDKKEVTGTEYKLRNTAEIGDDNGDDDDSTPGNDSKIKEEDDLDIEDLKLVEFDLALLKYVSTVYVTEDGKETVTQTNNVGNDETDIIPKVEVNRKKINKTVVKFGYTIKITNEGDIAGYAKEITDYVPEGLKFYDEDNQGWTDEGNNVISTKLLENTLLQPGESAQVTVILRWINGSENLGVKINTAEISQDYNDKHVPDRDSTPDNKVPGEDDIDDAPVLLSIKTGLGENVMMYVGGSLIILAVLGSGIALIKKYVL